MRRFLQLSVSVTLLLLAAEQVVGFSLVGPRPPWQTAALGFQPPAPNTFGGNGGPMNINEEYRWNVPTIHYGFSAEFLSYYGQGGVDSVEEAVAILNGVSDVESVDLSEVPTESGRMNLRAAALGLTDLKSSALSLMLQARGLADPTRYAFIIRNRYLTNNNQTTNYYVIQRNFDPETLRPSSFINGTLWTYIVQDPVGPSNYAWANNFPADPLERLLPRTLPVAGIDLSLLPSGFFFTQLTRDDVGGLKHIYRSSNYNTENALGDVAGAGGAGAVGGQVGFPGGGDTFDFPSGATGVGGGTFDFPFSTATNAVAGAGQAVGVGAAAGATAGTFVNPALKAGINSLEMVRADYDSLVGVFFNPLTVRFSETVLTNDRPRSQSLTRTVLQPDIIFDARDLQGADSNIAIATVVAEGGANGWNNSDALDGVTGDDFGPGVIVPPFRIIFNAVGPIFMNQQSANTFFLTEGSIGTQSLLTWGSFDGSTNDPIVYPVGTSILDLERQVR